MSKITSSFLIKLVGFTAGLFAVHVYLLSQFFEGNLHFPIWTIYAFNVVLVCVVYFIIRNLSENKSKKIFQIFMILTMVKMMLAIVFLSPLFFGKSAHTQLEVINFFIPYFLFLSFEIFSLNQFLQKT
jgi:hypothetical protein